MYVQPIVHSCPLDAPALLASAAARQAVTPTALAQARLPARSGDGGSLAPADGAFARAVASAFTGWKDE